MTSFSPVRISFHPFLFHWQQRSFCLVVVVFLVLVFVFWRGCVVFWVVGALFFVSFPFASLYALALSLTGAQRTDSSSASKKKHMVM